WEYGNPPAGNANYAWLQHMIHHLGANGSMALLLANGSMSSNTNTEGDIRQAFIEGNGPNAPGDLVECMVALPGQLFTNTQIPACIWFLTHSKAAYKGKRSRHGEVLFIDARKQGRMISRVQAELSDDTIARIAATVAAWRGEAGAGDYADEPGYCRSVTLSEIAEHGHVLTPGRYVGAEAVENDDEVFADRMQALTEKLGEQMAKGAELDQLIRQKLGGLGYEF
ncbi:MAG: N-6 DNA methylase, partial [Methyloversatilis sp.]|nr:N-6 DNA methylase [Methyloversatilis sp.]